MKKYFFSQIEWLDFSEGGRKVIPEEGARYGPLIELDDYELESESRWSVVFVCPNFDKTNKIIFSFLVDDAPDYKIEIGHSYGLYEGKKKVATVVVEKIILK